MVKLIHFQGKSVAFQIGVDRLGNLPNLMTNFNQLVLQEFVIQKIFICFDMPLSTINKVQAQSINDLDNYLMAKSIKSTISIPHHDFTELDNKALPFELRTRKTESLTAEKVRDEIKPGDPNLKQGASTATKDK